MWLQCWTAVAHADETIISDETITYSSAISLLKRFLLLARYVLNVAKRSIMYNEISVRRSIYWRPNDLSFGTYWGNFKWPYLHEGSSGPLHVCLYCGVCGVGRSNGANTGKPRDAASVTRCSINGNVWVSSVREVLFGCLAVKAMG